jgi:hypothetical protein
MDQITDYGDQKFETRATELIMAKSKKGSSNPSDDEDSELNVNITGNEESNQIG